MDDRPPRRSGWRPDWPGWSERRTLVLPLPAALWSPPAHGLSLHGVAFQPKGELHFTLVGSQLGNQLHAALGAAALEQVSRTAFERLDWSFIRSGHWRMLRQNLPGGAGRVAVHTIIELAALPAMADFHRALGAGVGRQLAVPPAHVTLYTAGKPGGIGVASEAALRTLTVMELEAPANSGA